MLELWYYARINDIKEIKNLNLTKKNISEWYIYLEYNFNEKYYRYYNVLSELTQQLEDKNGPEFIGSGLIPIKYPKQYNTDSSDIQDTDEDNDNDTDTDRDN